MSESANEPTKFRVNGREYEMPSGGFTIGEARIIKRWTGRRPDQLAPDDYRFDPDVIGVVIYLAIRRENPHVTEEDINSIKLEALDVDAPAGQPEGDAGPPEQPKTGPEPSGSESASSTSSGASGATDGARSPETPIQASTGPPGSPTGSV